MKFEELYQELRGGVEMIRALVGDDGGAGAFRNSPNMSTLEYFSIAE